MDDITVEQVITLHRCVMKIDGGDDRLLSEASLHQMVFSANRIEECYSRAGFAFFSLVAYPAFREGNSHTARLVAETILNQNGFTLGEDTERMDTLVKGIEMFTAEQADVEVWICYQVKNLTKPSE